MTGVVRSVLQNTRESVLRKRWWLSVFGVSILLAIFAAVVPLFLLVRFDMLWSPTEELSLSRDTSLLRLLLPFLGIAVALPFCCLLIQVVIEFAKLPRPHD